MKKVIRLSLALCVLTVSVLSAKPAPSRPHRGGGSMLQNKSTQYEYYCYDNPSFVRSCGDDLEWCYFICDWNCGGPCDGPAT